MSESSDSELRRPIGSRKRTKRKIVMRIEYGGTSDESSSEDEKFFPRAALGPAPTSMSNEAFMAIPGSSKGTTAVLEYSDHSVWEEDWHSGGEVATARSAEEAGQQHGTERDGNSSDSSCGSSHREKCPICLFSFSNQEVGHPQTCDHKFCAICIDEWSKNVSTCPIDRKEFGKIICLENFLSDRVTREIVVDLSKKSSTLEEIIEVDEDLITNCEICGSTDREDSMLLCDGCNHGYHMECLVPPLSEIPVGFWYCDNCFSSSEEDAVRDTLQEEIAELLDEVQEFGMPETRFRIRTEDTPRILRTRQSERIRSAILARTNRRAFRDSDSDQDDAQGDNLEVVPMPGPSRLLTSTRIVRPSTNRRTTATSGTRTTNRRKTRRRASRKTLVVEYDVDQENDKFAIKTKKIYKKLKRRHKRKVKNSRRCNNSGGVGRQTRNSETNRTDVFNYCSKDELTVRRMRAGIPKLSLFGTRNDLDYVPSDDDGDDDNGAESAGGGGGGLGYAVRTRPYNHLSNIRNVRNRKGGLIIPETAMATTTPMDLLGSIMEEQERWFTISNRNNISNIKIKPDGSLEFVGSGGSGSTNRSDRVVVPKDSTNSKIGATITGAAANVQQEAAPPPNDGGGATTTGNSNQRVTASSAQGQTSNINNNTGNDTANAGTGAVAGAGISSNHHHAATLSASGGGAPGPSPSYSTASSSGKVNPTPPPYRTAAAKKAHPEDQKRQEAGAQLYGADDLKVGNEGGSAQDNKNNNGDQENKASSSSTKSDNDAYSSDEDCPNFSLYSAETMALAKTINEPQTADEEHEPIAEHTPDNGEEREEDQVQLDDDDDDDNDDDAAAAAVDGGCGGDGEGYDNPQAPETLTESQPIIEMTSDDRNKTTTTTTTVNGSSGSNKKCELELYDDSDWDEWNNEKTDEEKSEERKAEEKDDEDDETVKEEDQPNEPTALLSDQLNTESISDDEEVVTMESRRSLTPCLDEKQHSDEGGEVLSKLDSVISDKKKIEGLELISDDEIGNSNDVNASVAEKQKKVNDGDPPAAEERTANATSELEKPSSKEDEFKKLSKNTKERNYRDKERSKSPNTNNNVDSRSAKRRKAAASDQKRGKRKDMERYDVRNVIERKPLPSKDKYGRDRNATPPVSSKRRRSKSRSCSLSSLSLIESRSSRSRSLTISGPARRKRDSPKRHRGRSRSRSPARRRRHSRSITTKRPAKRSLSRFTMSPSVSRSPTPPKRKLVRRSSPEKREKYERNGRSKKRHDRSPSPTVMKKRDEIHSEVTAVAYKHRRRSWSAEQPVLSANNRDELEPSWTPPLRLVEPTVNPEHFKVVLKNTIKEGGKGGGKDKKEKRSKKKRSEKSGGKDSSTLTKREKRTKKRSIGQSAGALKEVFASGDNIVVSVNFKDGHVGPSTKPTQQTTIVTLPPSKDQIMTQKKRHEQRELRMRQERREHRKTSSSKRAAKRDAASPPRTDLTVTKRKKRHRKVDAKPVAIIDLDRSPFKEMTPSPKAVIVLSDSDQEDGRGVGGGAGKKRTVRDDESKSAGPTKQHTGETDSRKSQTEDDKTKNDSQNFRATNINDDDNDDNEDSSFSIELLEATGPQTHQHAQHSSLKLAANLGGPKTPPEPTLKFSMAMKSKMSKVRAAANPLHDVREEEEEQLQLQDEQQRQQQQADKEAAATGKATTEETLQTTTSVATIITSGLDETVQGCDEADGSSTTSVGLSVKNSSSSTGAASLATTVLGNVVIGNNSMKATTTNNNNNNSNATSNNISNVNNKIGPNTPPEPAPSSPDVYDPFEPTKSNSQSPSSQAEDMEDASLENSCNVADASKMSLNSSDIAMKLATPTCHQVHHLSDTSSHSGLSPLLPPPQLQADRLEKLEQSLDPSSKSTSITIFSNVLLQSGAGSGVKSSAMDTCTTITTSSSSGTITATSNKTPTSTSSYSIMKQLQSDAKRTNTTGNNSGSSIFKKVSSASSLMTATNATTTTMTTVLPPVLTQALLKRHNAECAMLDLAADSPYSPGSSDFDDLFEPPSQQQQDTGGYQNQASGGKRQQAKANATSPLKGIMAKESAQPKNQTELFDVLFGSTSPMQPVHSTWNVKKSSHGRHQSGSGGAGERRRASQHKRIHSSLLEDDVPGSATELFVKDAYLKKLNHQERIVEEVKHVLKPHFHKKHITKEDYKEIMRKSVPKICRSRTGEINPQKIQVLVEAYVKKYRYKRKYASKAALTSAALVAAAAASNMANTSSMVSNQNKSSNNANSSISVNSKSRWT